MSRCSCVCSAIPQEYRSKAQRLDREFCGVEGGSPGPISQKLASYGNLQCLVFGAFGEASPDVHELVQVLASAHASRHWGMLRGRDPQDAAAICARSLYRSWGMMAVRGQARVKLTGMGHVGNGAAAAASRRVGAAGFHKRRREAYQLHFAAERLQRRWH